MGRTVRSRVVKVTLRSGLVLAVGLSFGLAHERPSQAEAPSLPASSASVSISVPVSVPSPATSRAPVAAPSISAGATSPSGASGRTSLPAPPGMARIPGGRFTMGASDQRGVRAARPVSIAPFWMDRLEVTVAAYRACVERGACIRPRKSSASCTYDLGDGELPVSCVNWSDADRYCRASAKRLPTEGEWEFAARGPFSLRYPWTVGGIDCAHAVTLVGEQTGKSCGGGQPSRVGAHVAGASAFGLFDMSGNLEEWVADWYVPSGPSPRAGASHVLRGGGWQSPPSLSRTTSRNWGSAMEAGPNVGFRCAKDG